MVNMRMLIRIVLVIFIANGIDCLGGVCDNWCNCFKEKEEDKKEVKILDYLLFFFIEPMVRIEITAPSLPRKCSTTELHRQE